MDARVAERAGAVARGGERLHQPDGVARAVGVVGREPAPGVDGAGEVAGLGALPGERLERVGVLPGEEPALGFDPALELGRIGEEEPVQEGAGVQAHGLVPRLAFHRIAELPDVAHDDGGVEPQVRPHRQDGLAPQLLVQPVNGVGEGVAGPLLVALGPQITHQFVPADPPLRRRGERREQPEAAGLHGAAGDRAVGALDGCATQELEREHLSAGDPPAMDRRDADEPCDNRS